MPYITVDVDVELDEFDTDDLREELRRRGASADTLPEGFDPIEGKGTVELAEACFEARRRGDDDRALELIDRLIYAALGRII
ncbi:hypothetical protein F0A17_01755 [Billgrantia pellis]|uniref:Uncharacterized protein n=1 Tax=Billgrantia pellis TaxID=2606936 RepID=A0A7V7G2R4_9GAMM|nr:hypothetical protein [Halomonas pellis]KAA0014399.1 hypothetical protein F0A17_01755 [Halomonas pellis]